jgi:hypothetical protein
MLSDSVSQTTLSGRKVGPVGRTEAITDVLVSFPVPRMEAFVGRMEVPVGAWKCPPSAWRRSLV